MKSSELDRLRGLRGLHTELSSNGKTDRAEQIRFWLGSHRTCDPAATIKSVEPHLEDFGITRVARITGLDRIGLETVMVTRPNAKGLAVRHGKGLTREAAIASGMMEAVEQWHAEHPRLPLTFGSFNELRTEYLVADPGRLPRPATSCYGDDQAILWATAFDLGAGQTVLVPYEMVHTHFVEPALPGHEMFEASTNGLASGNTLCEALNHAIFELIERDATTLFALLPEDAQFARRVALDFQEPTLLKLLDRLNAAALQTVIWETTTDIGVPSFVTAFVDGDDPTMPPGLGAGCHLSPEVALIRSLTEAAQTRLAHIAGTRDDFGADLYDRTSRIRARWKLEDAARPEAGIPPRSFASIADKSSSSTIQDLHAVLRALREAGHGGVLAVDLAPDRTDYSVVRVVVPGLEGLNEHGDLQLGERARRLLSQ